MEIKSKGKRNKNSEKERKGISLITLVVTIVVIIILAAAVILSLNNNNPVGRASDAVRQQDRANVQDKVTIVLASIQTKYLCSVEVIPGNINEGIEYKLINPQNANGVTGGIIGWNEKIGEEGGKDNSFTLEIERPTYKQESTTWYIDEQGRVTLTVGDEIYGEEEIVESIIDFEKILEEANKEPEKYKHEEQTTSEYIGIGTDGRPVNMDLWKCTYGSEDGIPVTQAGKEYGYNLCNLEGGGSKAYLGEEFENIVMPQYIKGPEDEEFLPVTQLSGTFAECEKLEKAPKIPSTVNMMISTFSRCSNLREVTNIPDGVTNMYACFFNCSNLEEIPTIPDSVTNMSNCFSECTSLEVVPNIPDSVTDMSGCFYGCSNLEEIPTIPDSVTDMLLCFVRCSSLRKVPTIPDSVTNMQNCFENCYSLSGTIRIEAENISNVEDLFWGTTKNKITVQVPKDSLTYENIVKECGGMSNITIETF